MVGSVSCKGIIVWSTISTKVHKKINRLCQKGHFGLNRKRCEANCLSFACDYCSQQCMQVYWHYSTFFGSTNKWLWYLEVEFFRTKNSIVLELQCYCFVYLHAFLIFCLILISFNLLWFITWLGCTKVLYYIVTSDYIIL